MVGRTAAGFPREGPVIWAELSIDELFQASVSTEFFFEVHQIFQSGIL